MKYGCEGKRAVISGGTSGIGLAVAKTLLADGAEVWLLARHEQPQLLAELQNAYADKVHFMKFGFWHGTSSRSFWLNCKTLTLIKCILLPAT